MLPERYYPSEVVFSMWRWTEIDVTLDLDLTASSNKEWLMTFISVRCPYCHSDQVVKRGKTRRGQQSSLCQNAACTPQSFLLAYSYRGLLPEVGRSATMNVAAAGSVRTATTADAGRMKVGSTLETSAG